MPVNGLFDITIGNRTLEDVSLTTSGLAMERLFNIEFKDNGGKCREKYAVIQVDVRIA